MSTPSRFGRLQAGTWCLQVRTPSAASSRCVTVAEAAAPAKNEHPFDTLLVEGRRGDPVVVEVAGKLHRSSSTEEAARIASFVGKVIAAAGPTELSRFEDLVGGAVDLAGGAHGGGAVGQAWRFRLGEPCASAGCVGSLGEASEFAVTFGLAPHDRARARVSEGRLVGLDDEPLAVPLILVKTSITAWDDQLLSLDCRRDWASATVRDGRELACADLGLEVHQPQLRQLKRLVDAARLRSATDEELALAAGGLARWSTESCGAALPAASAPCNLAQRLARRIETSVPEAVALERALRAAEGVERELSSLPFASDACAAVARLRPRFDEAEAAALQLTQCADRGCTWSRLNELRTAAQTRFGNGVGACFVQRVAASAAAPGTSPAARVLLQSLTSRSLAEGVTEAVYSPSAPPTAEALAEAVAAVTRAEEGLPAVPPVTTLHRAFLNEMNHMAQLDALITGGVKALQLLVVRSLELAVSPVAGSPDAYVQARIAHARELSAEVSTRALFAGSSRPGAPVFTPRARELLLEVVELENEFVHLTNPPARETAALSVTN